jgi:hypothetical protein
MKSRRFELFKEMVGSVPAKGVLRAIELEEWMIKDDLAHHRDLLVEDAVSISDFSRFLHAARSGEPVSHGSLPVEHLPYYQEVVKRLIDAGELSYTAQEQFENAFLSDFMGRIAA